MLRVTDDLLSSTPDWYHSHNDARQSTPRPYLRIYLILAEIRYQTMSVQLLQGMLLLRLPCCHLQSMHVLIHRVLGLLTCFLVFEHFDIYLCNYQHCKCIDIFSIICNPLKGLVWFFQLLLANDLDLESKHRWRKEKIHRTVYEKAMLWLNLSSQTPLARHPVHLWWFFSASFTETSGKISSTLTENHEWSELYTGSNMA